MSVSRNIFAAAIFSSMIVIAAQSVGQAQTPSPGGYGDPSYAGGGVDNPSLRIPRAGSDLRGPVDNSFVQDPNALAPNNGNNAYQAQGDQVPTPTRYKKQKKNVSGVGMAVGGPAKAAKTATGATDRGVKTVVGGSGKAVKEVFKAIF